MEKPKRLHERFRLAHQGFKNRRNIFVVWEGWSKTKFTLTLFQQSVPYQRTVWPCWLVPTRLTSSAGIVDHLCHDEHSQKYQIGRVVSAWKWNVFKHHIQTRKASITSQSKNFLSWTGDVHMAFRAWMKMLCDVKRKRLQQNNDETICADRNCCDLCVVRPVRGNMSRYV